MDCFALLDEPRQPWLDAAALKEKFLTQSAPTHPDKFTEAAEKEAAQARFTELNTAHETLRAPKHRLAHLLTLERGAKPGEVHDIPPDTADLFLAVGSALKPVDSFLSEQNALDSSLLKARAMPRALQLLDQVNTLQQEIHGRLEAADKQLQELNNHWPSARALEAAEQLYHEYSYLGRWCQQLQDRAVRLGF